MSKNLVFYAGKKALAHIRSKGLSSDDVKVVLGAAGGPKWLMLAEMDRFLFGQWLPKRQSEVHLLGSSIGAWRHSMYCSSDPMGRREMFLHHYVHQRYSERPDRREITDNVTHVLDLCLPPEMRGELLEHPHYRLHVMTVRSRGLTRSENRAVLGAGLMATGVANAISRKHLGKFFERVLFHHPGGRGPFFEESNLPMTHTPLTGENLGDVLCASGSIPLVIDAVQDIAGAPKGVYRDGGLVDYHYDIPIPLDEGVVLFPHFSEKVVAGWFDKFLKWRKPNTKNRDNLLLVAPSKEFIAGLPHGKITDRKDFEYYAGKNDHRITYWNAVLGETERLHDELAEILTSNSLDQWVQPFP